MYIDYLLTIREAENDKNKTKKTGQKTIKKTLKKQQKNNTHSLK